METPENASWMKDGSRHLWERKIDQEYKNSKGVGSIVDGVQVFGINKSIVQEKTECTRKKELSII